MCLRDLLRLPLSAFKNVKSAIALNVLFQHVVMCRWFRSVLDIASQNSRYKQLCHLCACQISCTRRRVNEILYNNIGLPAVPDQLTVPYSIVWSHGVIVGQLK